MIELLLFLGALLGTLLMGAGVLSAIKVRRVPRRHGPMDAAALAWQGAEGPAFRPLEMEPFNMTWPSLIERKRTQLPQPPWPSETWDDEFFGQQAKADVRRMQKNAQELDEKREKAYREDAARAADLGRRQGERSASKKKKKAKPQEQPSQRDRTAEIQAEQKRQKVAHEQGTEAAFFQEATTQGQRIPDAAQIAELVKVHGLSGAVEQIRALTGWDFKTAARHLANVLRNT